MDAILWAVAVVLILWFALRQADASDEAASLPENDEAIRRRINEREVLGAIARRQLAELSDRRTS